MKHVYIFLSIVSFLGGMIVAKPASATDGTKFAVVNLQHALNSTEEGKKAKSDLQKEGEQKKQQLTLMENDLKKLQEDIQKQKAILSESALKEKADTFKQKYTELQQKASDFEQELKKKETQNVDRILSGLRTVVTSIAGQKGYTYVLENSQGTLVYIDKSVPDITSEVIAAYNAGGGKKK